MNLKEAKKYLNKNGYILEDYPGRGYKKPFEEMIDEIKKAGLLEKLRDSLINAVKDKLERVLPMHMYGIHSDSYFANSINIGREPADKKEAMAKAREIFAQAKKETGVPVHMRESKPCGKNGYGEWLVYFNLFCTDLGHIREDEMASFLSNNDEYWEIIDDLYRKIGNKSVKYEPSEDEKNVIHARDTNILKALNKISRAPLTKKDWERFNTSSISRQLGTLSKMSGEKLASRKHAILLMMAKQYGGGGNDVIVFGPEEIRVANVSSFLRSCGINIPQTYTYKNFENVIKNLLKEIREYFKDELEVLEQEN